MKNIKKKTVKKKLIKKTVSSIYTTALIKNDTIKDLRNIFGTGCSFDYMIRNLIIEFNYYKQIKESANDIVKRIKDGKRD